MFIIVEALAISSHSIYTECAMLFHTNTKEAFYSTLSGLYHYIRFAWITMAV